MGIFLRYPLIRLIHCASHKVPDASHQIYRHTHCLITTFYWQRYLGLCKWVQVLLWSYLRSHFLQNALLIRPLFSPPTSPSDENSDPISHEDKSHVNNRDSQSSLHAPAYLLRVHHTSRYSLLASRMCATVLVTNSVALINVVERAKLCLPARLPIVRTLTIPIFF
jgi:hypothetical protein